MKLSYWHPLAGDDTIEIADWGKAYIDEVAEFEDGVWQLKAPSCPPRAAKKIAAEKRFTRGGIHPIGIVKQWAILRGESPGA